MTTKLTATAVGYDKADLEREAERIASLYFGHDRAQVIFTSITTDQIARSHDESIVSATFRGEFEAEE